MSDEVKIRTNNVPRDVVEAWELSPAERDDFDFLDWEAIEDGRDSASFVRFKGDLHYLGDFLRWDGTPSDQFAGWDGYNPDSFFSGMLIRYARDDAGELDPERVIVATYYA